MSAAFPRLALSFLPLLLACTGSKPDDSGDSGSPTPAADTAGLPEGSSTWSGSGEIAGYSVLVEATLINTGGDLAGTVTISDDPATPIGLGSGSYTIVGTHAPESGVLAVAPVEWTELPDFESELIGATGTHDPDARTLSGMLRDWASGSDNSLLGGPFLLSWVDGDGEPSAIGDEARSLADGSQSFSGTIQCTGAVRDVEGTLTYDGVGGITGSITVGDPGLDTPLGTFPFDGAHNPSTGTITIAPQPWESPVPSTLNFMASGTYDPASGAWTGDMLTNLGACPAGTWLTTVGAR